jgi:hypothetical protein
MGPVLTDTKSPREPGRGSFPPEAVRIAITGKFVDRAVAGHMTIHPLWIAPDGAYFRVNWWGLVLKGTVEAGRVCNSAFVRVFHDGETLQAEDRSNDAESTR